MADNIDKIAVTYQENEEKSLELLGKLIDATRPDAVFSRPMKVEDIQVITASEIRVGLGYGHSLGSGLQVISNLSNENSEESEDVGIGGGGASGRPVAVITIKENAVEIEPVVDATKIALAFFTMVGSIFFLGFQIRKGKLS